MADTKNTAASFMDQWKQNMSQQMERFESFQQDMVNMEATQHEQATKNFQEMSRLMQESFQYTQQLGNEWRKLTLESTRRAASMMTTPWS